MDTTDRMMIMGLCLQGILANPNLVGRFDQKHRPIPQADLDEQIAFNVAMAHKYADALDPPVAQTDAAVITAIARTAYEALRAADLEGAGRWPAYDDARQSLADDHMDAVEGVFTRVGRAFKGEGFPETIQDRVIWAITNAAKAA